MSGDQKQDFHSAKCGRKASFVDFIQELIDRNEKVSALDYYFWNNKLLYLTIRNEHTDEFERDFQNAVILRSVGVGWADFCGVLEFWEI